ncbi:MAG: HEPN domain-containing protein [Alphaproteobacteria bacterium]|nr:HEPN domain-containing protein [Alphaproteobacteria bacterium]
MSSEVDNYLHKARMSLVEAKLLLPMELYETAGRLAYMAAFHAAQAYIFSCNKRAVKTHSGVRSELARLLTEQKRDAKEYTTFLGWAYTIKEIADYEVGENATLPADMAHEALAKAERFVSDFEKFLEESS